MQDSISKKMFFFRFLVQYNIFCGVMFLVVFLWCLMSDAIIACMLETKRWQWIYTSCDDQKYLFRKSQFVFVFQKKIQLSFCLPDLTKTLTDKVLPVFIFK